VRKPILRERDHIHHAGWTRVGSNSLQKTDRGGSVPGTTALMGKMHTNAVKLVAFLKQFQKVSISKKRVAGLFAFFEHILK